MKDIKRLLELRAKAKRKKPRFVIKESNYKARVEEKWRYPRGLHSAVRQRNLGRPVLPRVGYSSPKEVRGLHSSGLEKVIVYNDKQLLSLNPKGQGAIIASDVGMKKKLLILKAAQERKIRVLNVRDLGEMSIKLQHKFNVRKKLKDEKTKLKNKKEEEKMKRAEEKKKKEEEEKAKEKAQKEGAIEGAEAAAQDKENKENKEEKEVKEKVLIKKQV